MSKNGLPLIPISPYMDRIVSISFVFFLVFHCVKYVEKGLSLIRILPHLDRIVSMFSRIWENTGKYGYDLVHIQQNTDQRNPVFRQISRSVHVLC